MSDPLMEDLEDNPLLSSLVDPGARKPVPKKVGREGKRVNASVAPAGHTRTFSGEFVNSTSAGSSVHSSEGLTPVPPLGAPRPDSSGRRFSTLDPAPDTARSSISVASTVISEAGDDLVDAFTTLKKKKGWKENVVGAVVIEQMKREELISFAKSLYAMVETFQLKAHEADDNDSLESSASMVLTPSASMTFEGRRGLPGSGAYEARASFIGGSMVFRRRPPNQRPNSGGSGESQMSIMRAPVTEKNTLKKSLDDEGFKTINEYTIVAELGRGAYGKVKLAANEITGETVAIKIMKKSILKGQESVVMREIAIMKKIRHRNVVSLYEVINDPAAEKIYMVMQYVENGSLYVLNKQDLTTTPIPSEKLLPMLRQLVSGLRYLHKRNIVHRDIKPDNILVGSDGTPYLADFGVSEIAQTGSIRNMEGTPMFLAPEMFRGDKHIDGTACDVWALGITMYGALYGRLPFIGKNYEAVSRAVQTHPLHFPVEHPATAKWRDALSRLIEKDPKLRITLRELKQHPIFDVLNASTATDAKARKDAVHEVEVTDLEVLESIRVVAGFGERDKGISKAFALKCRAKVMVHRFVDHIRAKIKAAKEAAASHEASVARGSGISAIRGITPRSIIPASGKPVGTPKIDKRADAASHSSEKRNTPPHLPELRDGSPQNVPLPPKKLTLGGVSPPTHTHTLAHADHALTGRFPSSNTTTIAAASHHQALSERGSGGGSARVAPRLPSLRKVVRKK